LRSKPFIRWVIFGSFTSYVIYTVLRTLSHVPYYSGVGFGANLVLLSFIWVAGLRLARSKGGDKTALRDIGLIMVGYMAVDVVIQFGHRFKHHAVAEFFQHDSIGFAARSATLFFVFLIFKYLVIPPRLSVRRSWFLRFLGDVSYPLYLLHGAIYAIIAHLGLKIPALFYIIAVLVSALVYWSLDFYSKKRHQQLDPDKPTQPIPDIKTKLAPELL